MSGSCCADASKAESPKVATTSEPQMTGAAPEKLPTKSDKSECCKDSPTTSEKQGCGC